MADAGDIGTDDPGGEQVGLTRRQTLKRGALLGGALAWATPVVQVIGMKPAFAVGPSGGTEDLIVRITNGPNTRCFRVTQEVFDCYQTHCVQEDKENIGCLQQCDEDHGAGQLDELVPCPPET